MTRGGPDLAAESASREHLKRVRKNQAATGIGDAPPVAPPRPEPFVPGQAHYGRGASRRPSFPGFSTDQDFGNAGRPRASRPKQNMGGGPTPRAQQAYEEFQTGQAGARDAFGGAFNGAFRGQYRSAYQRFGEQPGEEPIVEGQSNRRVRALLAMAKATESPEEAQTAQEMLKRMGITHFDVGGVLPPWTTIKREMKVQGAAPRPGSKLRKAIEQRYLSRVQNREKRAKKPKYMQGGKSDPKYAAVRAAQIKKQPWCASCGSTENLTADHIHDTASGGDIYDPSNFQTLCLSCNSRKSGGSKARPILTPYAKFAPGADPWGSDRTSFEDEMGFNRRAMGGPMKKGKWKWGKYAEGGDTGGTYRSGGLLERMAQAGHQPSITMVGERGPELIVTDEKGDSEVVPTHKVPTWLQRAQEGRGVAKDMTGRAGGGPIRFRQNGAYAAQGSVAGAAVQAGLASSLSGGVQRVFVTNWPSGTAVAGYGSVGQRPAQAKAAAPVGAPAGAQQQSPGAFQPGAHAPQPGSVPKGRIKINPLTRVESRRLGYTSTEDIEERLQRVGAGIQESLQEAPVRALSVAFGQIAQTAIGGRGGILARAAGARRLAGGARREQGELTRLETQRRELALQTRQLRAGPQNQQTTDQITSNIGELKQLGPAIIRQRQITEARTSRAEQAQGSILSRGQQFRAQAVGLGGIIAGTQLFTTAVAALSGAEQAASAALKPLVDQFLGWPAAIDKVTASVRDSIQAANGNVRGGVAGALAPSGISAAFLDQQGGNVTQIATSRAAQLAAQQGLDVTRAAAASGGSSRGLFEGTGGLLGSNIATDVFGGQEGFLQTVAKRLQVNRPSELQKAVGSLGNPLGGALNTGPADRGFLGLFPNDRAQFEDAQKRLATENRNTGSFYEDNQAKADEDIVRRFQSSQGSPDRQQGVIKDLNRNLSDAAKYAGDAAGAFKLVTGATQEQTDAMIKSAQATNDQGAVDRAKDFAASGVTVLGPGGRALQGAEFQKYAEQQARGTLIQDPALLLRQTQQQRQAQVDQMRAQLQFTQREDIPAQFALENAAKPQQHFGTTFTTQGLAGTQGGDQTLQNIQKYTQLAGAAQQDIQKSITEGQQSLNAIVSRAGPEALQDFTKTVDSISSLGSTITGLQEGISFRQVNLETHEYNEQLRLADRSLGDAKDFMSAIHGAVIGTVGGLQGQNALLDRQNQLLGRRQQQLSFKSEDIGFKSNDLQYQLQQMQFAQTQRQINFSKASAGFTAPGDTPEERAARIEQAKIEAREAQKQLNIQRQIAAMAREQLQIARQSAQINRQVFANQNKQQDNAFKQTIQEASRSVGDLEKQIGLLTESHAINIDSRAVDETVAKLEKQQGRLINKAQAYLQAGQDIRSNIIAGVADIQAATGKGWSELVGQVNKAWQSLFSGYATEYKNLLGTINGGSGTPGARGSGPAGNKLQAEGGIHVVNRATRFVAGEAGSEAVLVIRNPQQGMMSMPSYTAAGGGGATINIMVSGNTVRSDKDIDTLVYRIKREMSRDLALSGGRRNF
jgi:hypothetical protein